MRPRTLLRPLAGTPPSGNGSGRGDDLSPVEGHRAPVRVNPIALHDAQPASNGAPVRRRSARRAMSRWQLSGAVSGSYGTPTPLGVPFPRLIRWGLSALLDGRQTGAGRQRRPFATSAGPAPRHTAIRGRGPSAESAAAHASMQRRAFRRMRRYFKAPRSMGVSVMTEAMLTIVDSLATRPRPRGARAGFRNRSRSNPRQRAGAVERSAGPSPPRTPQTARTGNPPCPRGTQKIVPYRDNVSRETYVNTADLCFM